MTDKIPVPMDFSLALAHLKGGDRVARRSFPAVALAMSDGEILTAGGFFWLPSQSAILAEDWHVVKEGK